MSLPRLPEDKDLLDMIRAGINTVPGLMRKIYGYPANELTRRGCETRIRTRLMALKKYGVVRQTGETVQMGYGRNMAKIWEVIE